MHSERQNINRQITHTLATRRLINNTKLQKPAILQLAELVHLSVTHNRCIACVHDHNLLQTIMSKLGLVLSINFLID